MYVNRKTESTRHWCISLEVVECGVKSWTRARWPELGSWFCHLLAVSPLGKYLTSQCLDFVMYEKEIITVSTSHGCYGDGLSQHSSQKAPKSLLSQSSAVIMEALSSKSQLLLFLGTDHNNHSSGATARMGTTCQILADLYVVSFTAPDNLMRGYKETWRWGIGLGDILSQDL